MTVRELIAELQECDMDRDVWTEGCDCYGEAAAVMADDDEPFVLIARPLEDAK